MLVQNVPGLRLTSEVYGGVRELDRRHRINTDRALNDSRQSERHQLVKGLVGCAAIEGNALPDVEGPRRVPVPGGASSGLVRLGCGTRVVRRERRTMCVPACITMRGSQVGQDAVGAICCVAFVAAGAGILWWFLRKSGRVIHKSLQREAESDEAATRQVEFLCRASAADLARAIAVGVDSARVGVGNGELVQVTSQGSLGVVIQCSWWEIRVDFSEGSPVRGNMYLRLAADGGARILGRGRVVHEAEAANLVMDRVVAVVRQVDPQAQIHGH